jgi:hypothetical protein
MSTAPVDFRIIGCRARCRADRQRLATRIDRESRGIRILEQMGGALLLTQIKARVDRAGFLFRAGALKQIQHSIRASARDDCGKCE